MTVTLLYITVKLRRLIVLLWTFSVLLVSKMSSKSFEFHLEGVFPADVVVHRQHGDVKTGQQYTSQDAILFFICTGKKVKLSSVNILQYTLQLQDI